MCKGGVRNRTPIHPEAPRKRKKMMEEQEACMDEFDSCMVAGSGANTSVVAKMAANCDAPTPQKTKSCRPLQKEKAVVKPVSVTS